MGQAINIFQGQLQINSGQTKAFIATNKVGSMTMYAALSGKNSWKTIGLDKVPKTCQVYGFIRHPISKLASSLAQEWAAHKDWPNPYQVKLFRRILDNDFLWLMEATHDFMALQCLSLNRFPGIKIIQFENFNQIWGHLGIDNPGFHHNNSRANGFHGTARTLMERAAMEHESFVLDKYAEDLVIWEEAACVTDRPQSLRQRFEDATGIA